VARGPQGGGLSGARKRVTGGTFGTQPESGTRSNWPPPIVRRRRRGAGTRTTGILVGSASSIQVPDRGKRIARNHFEIFLDGGATWCTHTLHGNQFTGGQAA